MVEKFIKKDAKKNHFADRMEFRKKSNKKFSAALIAHFQAVHTDPSLSLKETLATAKLSDLVGEIPPGESLTRLLC